MEGTKPHSPSSGETNRTDELLRDIRAGVWLCAWFLILLFATVLLRQ